MILSCRWSNLDRDALQYLLLMLSANMPERLGRLYILNEGMIFKTLWKVVELSGLLDVSAIHPFPSTMLA